LRDLVQRPAEIPRADGEEQCDLCGESIPPQHRHLIDVQDRRLLCACRACSILFDHRGAGGGHFRLLPNRSRYVDGFELDDMLWQNFRIPVDLAFFFESSTAEKVVAFYPAPVGATESLLELDAWQQLVTANPLLEQLEPDVEALLVNRTRGARDHWIVPIDRCYELVGVIRTRWKGFGGGPDAWTEIDRFFDDLRREAKVVHNDRKETT
jgi:hypothetical protein